MLNRKLLYFSLLIILTCFMSIHAQTYVSGAVYDGIGGGPWTISGSPYIVTDGSYIPLGTTLTIDPGVIVKFDSGCNLACNGNLVADGNSSNMITFTSNQPTPAVGDWLGVWLRNSNCVVDYCVFEYGGATGTGGNQVWITKGCTVANSISRYSGNMGVWVVNNLSEQVTLQGCTIENNSYDGISISANSPNITIENCIIRSNGGRGVTIRGNAKLRGNDIVNNSSFGVGIEGTGNADLGIAEDPGNNRLYDNSGGADLYNGSSNVIYAQNNYWKEKTYAILIDLNQIYDDDENASLGQVIFEPFLSEDQSLPVTLSSFSVISSFNVIEVKWVTESEMDILGYILEKLVKGNECWLEISSYLAHDNLKCSGNTSSQTEYKFTDSDVLPGETYTYRLSDVDTEGNVTILDVISITLDDSFYITDILPPFPNPFNPITKIQYTLAEDAEVTLTVVDMMGRTAKTIISGQTQTSGSHSIHWNGKADTGKDAASGIYLLVFRAGEVRKIQKVMLVR